MTVLALTSGIFRRAPLFFSQLSRSGYDKRSSASFVAVARSDSIFLVTLLSRWAAAVNPRRRSSLCRRPQLCFLFMFARLAQSCRQHHAEPLLGDLRISRLRRLRLRAPHSSSLFRADRAGRYTDSGRRWWQFGRPVSASSRLIAFWVSTFSALGHRTRKPLCRPNVRPHFASFIGFATVRTEDLRDYIANFTTHWDPPFSSSRRLLLRHIKLTDVNLEWK